MKMKLTLGHTQSVVAFISVLVASILSLAAGGQTTSSREFEQAAYPALPTEEPYDFREVMVKEFNRSWRRSGSHGRAERD